MAFKYAVALTGGIATGKSSATILLSLFGFRFIDADKIAHAMLEQQHQKLIELFGEDVIKSGKVNRKAIGVVIFANPEKKRSLEQLLHPLIYAEIERQSEWQDKFKKPYIIDIPLFFETNRYPISRSMVVYTPVKKQLERLIKRDAFSTEEAMQRINAQMSIEEKKQKATYLIDNSGNLKALQDECDRVKEAILADF